MSSYAFFVQTCREEHKKKHPDASVNLSEFSKKCSERRKTMSAKEKGKFEDTTKADKVHYEREMETYISPKRETKKKFEDPNALKKLPSAFFLLYSEYRPKIKGEHPGLSIGDVAKNWEKCEIILLQMTSNLMKLKEKYEKDIATYRAKGKSDVCKKGGVVKAEKSKKKEKEEDAEDEEEEDEEDDDE